jgi:hypothetical protein
MATLIGTEYPMGKVMEIIGYEINALASGNSNVVPTIIGDPGIGKSASMKNKAESMNMDCYIISLGALPMEYYSGLPEFGTMETMAKYIVGEEIHPGEENRQINVKTAEWTMSDLVRSINLRTEKALKNGKEGLMVLLDDVHLVEPIVQKYLFEFFQNKTLQNYKLHDKAYLVAAMNGKDSAGLEDFHSAVINRMAFYFAKFDKAYWYEHIGHTLHPYIASFSNGPNDRYFTGANATDSASPSPRAWTELSGIIPSLEAHSSDNFILNQKLQITAESRVGQEAATEFMKHVKLFQKFDFETIFKEKDPDFKVSEDTSDQILTAFIIRYVRSKEDSDYLKVILEKNLKRRTFLSIFINEFVTLFRNIGDIQDPKTKEAFTHLSTILTSEDAIDSELMDIVVDSLLDIQS